MTDGRFRALIAASLALLAVMTLLGPAACGGVWRICSFDAQVLPYSPETARDYLKAIQPDIGRYLWIVQPLDLLLPVAVCLALREGFARWAPQHVLGLLRGAALVYLIVDYVENAIVHVMLSRAQDGFPDAVAYVASGLTTLKWTLLLPLLLVAAWTLLTRRRFDRDGAPR